MRKKLEFTFRNKASNIRFKIFIDALIIECGCDNSNSIITKRERMKVQIIDT